MDIIDEYAKFGIVQSSEIDAWEKKKERGGGSHLSNMYPSSGYTETQSQDFHQ